MRLQPVQLFEVKDSYEILASYEVVREVQNGITLDSSKFPAESNGDKILKKGMPVGKLSNGKYRAYTGTTLASDISASDTTAEVADASRYVTGDILTFDNGTNTEQKTIDSIDYTTNVITFTAQFSNAFATGSKVYTTDGGENPTVILKHEYNLKDGDHIAAGYEVAKVISERIPVTVDETLKSKMTQIVFG